MRDNVVTVHASYVGICELAVDVDAVLDWDDGEELVLTSSERAFEGHAHSAS